MTQITDAEDCTHSMAPIERKGLDQESPAAAQEELEPTASIHKGDTSRSGEI